MKSRRIASLALCSVLFSILLAPGTAHACSILCVRDGETAVVGYNFDWYKDVRGLVFINERGLSKTAFMPWDDKPASWTSKYGSITFNGCGKDMPFSGMNEAGLVVTQAYQSDAEYPEIDDRLALSELQWIQYQLDNFESVDEVIASDERSGYRRSLPPRCTSWWWTGPDRSPRSNSTTVGLMHGAATNCRCPCSRTRNIRNPSAASFHTWILETATRTRLPKTDSSGALR